MEKLIIFCVLVLNMITVSVIAGPLNYQDCILEANRKGGITSQDDVQRIKILCREQFPDTAPDKFEASKTLPKKVISKLTIYSNKGDEVINGTLYNGSSAYTVTRVTVLLTPINNGKDSIENFFDSEEFEINKTAAPFETTSFNIPLKDMNIKGEFSWHIVTAMGY